MELHNMDSAKQISVSNNEAQDFINSYFKKFPEIKEYMQSTIRFLAKKMDM